MFATHQFGSSGATVTWVDVIDPRDDELEQLAGSYQLETRAFDEARRRAARPTMQRFDDHAYVVAFSGALAEIDIYIGPAWLITVRHHDTKGREWDPAKAVERFQRRDPTTMTPGLLLATLMDELIDGYFDATDLLEDRIEEMEDRIFADTAHTEQVIQQDLFNIRRELIEIRRAVVPLREVISSILRLEVRWIEGEAVVLFRDAFDKLLRVIDLIDGHRELVGNAVDAHLAVISNQMNQVMKQLTAWGAIVFGATLIAGIYGMNFVNMPELDWRLGYPMALGMMLLLSGILYRAFRRRDWL
jgi:magnesium transporter